MTRHHAREVALHLIFADLFGERTQSSFSDSIFTKEYFQGMANAENIAQIYKSLPDSQQIEYISTLVNGVFSHSEELNSAIEKYSVGWKINRISKMSLSILRLSIFEILYMKDIPTSASINEAVEFTKQYDSEENVAFVNGILGSIARESLDTDGKSV